MIKESTWGIEVLNPPHLNKQCSRCKNHKFYCSEKFRMNAQKKNIDIWLIYRCSSCDNTFNMTILSRTKSDLIDKGLFDKFSKNDKETAWEYAFSSEIEKKNNVEIDFGTVEYQIKYKGDQLEDLLKSDYCSIVFRIDYPFNFQLKTSSIIKTCLNLSTSQLNKLIEAKGIYVQVSPLLRKYKVRNGDVVQINIKRFREIYGLWDNI